MKAKSPEVLQPQPQSPVAPAPVKKSGQFFTAFLVAGMLAAGTACTLLYKV
jgi:hypothetical protein